MNPNLKLYVFWSVVYLAAIVGLFWGTNLHLDWWQTGLLILAISTHGVAQRNYGRWDAK